MKAIRARLQRCVEWNACLLLAAGAATHALAQYAVVDLGALGGPTSAGFAVNDFGRVAGSATTLDGNVHGFVWNGNLGDIGPLFDDRQSHAFDIADSGQVVAVSYDLGDLVTHGFVWQSGVATSLGAFTPRGTNQNGVVVGYRTVNDPAYGWVDHAVRWVNGTLFELGTLGGHFSYAYSVTSDGRIVGTSSLAADSTRHAFLWLAGVFHDLGTLGGTHSQAYAVNENGDVVGWSNTGNGLAHAFLFTTDANGAVTARIDLGELGGGYSYAYAVNSHRQIVGTSASRAFLWEAGVMTDLNSLLSPNAGWRLEAAWDINEAGLIVGVGQHHGSSHAFLMRSTDCPDLNLNGVVDLSDLTLLLSHFGTPSGAMFEQGDLDADGDVDLSDLARLLASFGAVCP